MLAWMGTVAWNEWQRQTLEDQGFAGWTTWGEWPPANEALPSSAGGVYVVFRGSKLDPVFLEVSTSATHKNRDPSVGLDALQANWVPHANVVYIGKGNHNRLLLRLNEYRDMGMRRVGSHWGDRLIWQLADSADLRVAYLVLPTSTVPRDVERQMIAGFKHRYGKPPFANDPHRLGS